MYEYELSILRKDPNQAVKKLSVFASLWALLLSTLVFLVFVFFLKDTNQFIHLSMSFSMVLLSCGYLFYSKDKIIYKRISGFSVAISLAVVSLMMPFLIHPYLPVESQSLMPVLLVIPSYLLVLLLITAIFSRVLIRSRVFQVLSVLMVSVLMAASYFMTASYLLGANQLILPEDCLDFSFCLMVLLLSMTEMVINPHLFLLLSVLCGCSEKLTGSLKLDME